jgi:hypothetical protein
MSNEISFNSTLSIRKMDADGSTTLIQRTYGDSFVDDMTGSKGPTPGAITVPVKGSGGIQITFAQLTRPGYCYIKHLGRDDGSAVQAGDYIDIGIYDPATHKFYPILEWRPKMGYPLCLSRNLQEIYLGPGTGTAAGAETARLMAVAYPVPQKISVEAYEF